ncbi:MAG: Fe-S-containing hydro-lyase [Chloroflexi bacterium]|nr:Fe-S-containing hydro-lyase [Chloroflexota bacterium]
MAGHRVRLPLTDEVVEQLRVGDSVLLSGSLYTARDAAHRRMVEALSKGEPLPVDIRGQVIYYVGPTPAKPGEVIGSAGPTTAARMDPYTIPLLEAGLRGAIGKGGRGPQVREALRKQRAVYFLAVGGAGALLSKRIRRVEIVAYEELGTEAMRLLEVEEFPVVVCNDVQGGDLLEQGKARWRQAEVLEGPPLEG